MFFCHNGQMQNAIMAIFDDMAIWPSASYGHYCGLYGYHWICWPINCTSGAKRSFITHFGLNFFAPNILNFFLVAPEVYKQLWTKCQIQNQQKEFFRTGYCLVTDKLEGWFIILKKISRFDFSRLAFQLK